MAAMVAAEEVRPLKVKGWAGMHVREMSARDAAVARKLIDEEGKREGGEIVPSEAFYCAGVLCDAQGALLFDMRNREQMEFLAARGMLRLGGVLAAARALDAERLEDETEGNASAPAASS
jgi:hypothetical protein